MNALLHRTLRGALLLTFGLPAVAAAALGQEPPPAPKEAKDGRGKWAPLFQRHAGEYRVRVGTGGKEAARLPEPVLRWWQPVRGGDDGALYVWVVDGRPVAVVTFFTFKWPQGERAIVHERHSLSPEPVEAEWRGRVAWGTTKPGVTFAPVPGAPAPAATPAARLRQMQAIVRDVSASTTDDKGSNWPLRPLSKPLYRFEGPADGALFALAQGTDPEAFLLLRAEGAHWEFAVARFTDLRLRVLLQGREVFSGPNTIGASNEIYQSTTVMQKPSDNPDDFQ
jgi:hypothetical protein